MKLTKKEIKHIARLANLKLSSSQVAEFRTQLSQVISYVNKLQEVDTKGVDPTSQVTGLKNIFREDKVKPSLTQKEALSNAKQKYEGYFVTEKVV